MPRKIRPKRIRYREAIDLGMHRRGRRFRDSRGRVYEVQETGAWKRIGIDAGRGAK